MAKKRLRNFKTKRGSIPLPAFFPDATRAVIKTLDSIDIKKTKTPGILVNTFHLFTGLKREILKRQNIGKFMNWNGALISDSGGFQVMSLIKRNKAGSVNDHGIYFKFPGKEDIRFTPEESIKSQMDLGTDMVIVLDDFTESNANRKKAEKTVERTIFWAKRSKEEFERQCKKRKISKKKCPYILAVVQGGKYQDLREYCTKELVKIGFDGLGYGGWPIKNNGKFDYETAKSIVKNSPSDYLLHGLGIGKPEEIVKCADIGFNIFDCVLPTRDARHGRLYVFNAKSIDKINIRKKNFYSYFYPNKEKYLDDDSPVSTACDCLLCKNYSRAYLAHLFRIKEISALRLATIHNLRFYSILMEKIREEAT